MGVYVKGMEMPKGNDELRLIIHSNGQVIISHQTYYEEAEEAEAVPVPPHGRLIDADALAAEMKKRQEEAGKWLREAKDRETAVRADAVLSFLCEVKLTIDKMPTVIETDDKDINVPIKEDE